ncbi:MAG: hypothetical protein ACP6IY_12880 [Promethearchaeia archaeon]
MKIKVYNRKKVIKKQLLSGKVIFSIILIFMLLIQFNPFLIIQNKIAYNVNNFNDNKDQENNLNFPPKLNKEIEIKNKEYYYGLKLNNSIHFELNSTTYCKEIQLNFTQINETRNFIKNGGFENNPKNWNALNDTDIKFKWHSNGPNNSNCISINITGKNSTQLLRPINPPLGIENFVDAKGWTNHTNNPSNFSIELDPLKNHGFDFSSASLRHHWNGSIGKIGIGNSSYKFFYNSCFPLKSAILSLWYDIDFVKNPWVIYNITLSVIIITPNNSSHRLWTFSSDKPLSDFYQILLANISSFLTQTGYYSIILQSKHSFNSNDKIDVYFDDIELNITQSYNQLNTTNFLSWNQSISFDRTALTDGIFNFSYYITNKFTHINSSKIKIALKVNNIIYGIDSIKNSINNTWIKKSINILKDDINGDKINISIGIYFNKTTYIFNNESFSLFFDNISFVIKAISNSALINISCFVPELNKSFLVYHDKYNNDFVKIINESFLWQPGNIYYLNITANSSIVSVNIVATFYLIVNIEDNNEKSNEINNIETKPINITSFFMILILIAIFSTLIFSFRIQKELFLNPKYDYIKKIDFKKKYRYKPQKIYSDEIRKKRCINCGRIINERAKFCEFCGSSQ